MIYSTNYFGYEPRRKQAVPIHVITDLTDPIPPDDPRIATAWHKPQHDENHGRLAGVWWKTHPNLVTDDPVTIWVGGNVEVLVPDFEQRCLDELGDDDVLLMRHPWRDDIWEEERESHPNTKYDGQATGVQVYLYLNIFLDAAPDKPYPGLAHGGFIVQRNTPRVQALFGDRWWGEVTRWSVQDQLSLPYVIATSGLAWHFWPSEGQWRSRPFERGWIRYGQIGRQVPPEEREPEPSGHSHPNP